MSGQLLTAREVAHLLGHNRAWFYRNRATLEAKHGFPRAVAGCGQRWDGAAIRRWLDRQAGPSEGGQVAGDAPAMPAELVLIERARAMAGATPSAGA
jgi:predicted DNA-binding transcriptional regulator AlpA